MRPRRCPSLGGLAADRLRAAHAAGPPAGTHHGGACIVESPLAPARPAHVSEASAPKQAYESAPIRADRTALANPFGPWCKGSTSGFGPFSLGSNPSGPVPTSRSLIPSRRHAGAEMTNQPNSASRGLVAVILAAGKGTRMQSSSTLITRQYLSIVGTFSPINYLFDICSH